MYSCWCKRFKVRGPLLLEPRDFSAEAFRGTPVCGSSAAYTAFLQSSVVMKIADLWLCLHCLFDTAVAFGDKLHLVFLVAGNTQKHIVGYFTLV